MASPHVAGVAALIMSQFGLVSPGSVEAMIDATAVPQACPPNPFLGGTGVRRDLHRGPGLQLLPRTR